MKISIASKRLVSIYGCFGTVAYYQAAPVHEIFLQAIAAQPGLRVSALMKKFGLPMPACQQLLRPLLASRLVQASGPAQDPALEVEATATFSKKLPVHLLEDAWLVLTLPQPFHGHSVLGVIPASRFQFKPQELRPEQSLEPLHGSHFSATGKYSFKIGPDKNSDELQLKQGILLETLSGTAAFLGNKPAELHEDAGGSHLTLRFAGERLRLNLTLASPVIRPDLAALGQQALRQQNQRLGLPLASEPILRKRFADLTPEEKSTARGSLSEPVQDVLVQLQDLPVLPHSQGCYHHWAAYLFEKHLQAKGYAEEVALQSHLTAALQTIRSTPFTPPSLADLTPRLTGKNRMLARALADWPTL
jgi:hypothetical protein